MKKLSHLDVINFPSRKYGLFSSQLKTDYPKEKLSRMINISSDEGRVISNKISTDEKLY